MNSVSTDNWGRTHTPLTSAQGDLLQYIRGLAQPCGILPRVRVLPLDLNDDRQRQFFEERFADGPDFGRFFPRKREIFDATMRWQAENGGPAILPHSIHQPHTPSVTHPSFPGWRPETAAANGVEETLGTTWQPAAFIAAFDYLVGTEMGQVGANAVLTVPGITQLNELVLQIYDLVSGDAIASNSTGPQSSPYLSLGTSGTLTKPGNGATAYATGYYVPSSTSMAIPVVAVADTGGIADTSNVQEEAEAEGTEMAQPQLTLNVTAPINIRTPKGSTIKVALNRDAQVPDADYFYMEPTVGSLPQQISLAVMGTATAPAGNTFDATTPTNTNGSLITVSRNGGASVNWPPAQIAAAVSTATSLLQWTLNPAQYQGSPPWSNNDTCDLYFTLNFAMNHSPNGLPNTSLNVTSVQNTPPVINTAYTPPLMFMWGCLAADEPVRMADGTLRPVAGVAIGDRVRTAGGGALRVVNVTRGREPEPLVALALEDGRTVRMTDGHPVRTAEGWVLARHAAPGQRVETEEGTALVTAVERVRYEGEVHNLTLAPVDAQADDLDPEDAAFYAGGVLVGDNRLQGHAGGRALEAAARERRAWPVDPAWRHDVENFRRMQAGLPLVPAS